MSSPRRIAASRANGAKSRGAVTPEGLARAKTAAITHGLTSRRVILEVEPTDQFQTLRDLYLAHFQPADPFETDLVEQLVAARWRIERAWSLETALLDVEIARRQPIVEEEFKVCDAETRAALAFRALSDDSRALANIGRYESRYRRIYDKILKTLTILRAHRKPQNTPNPAIEHQSFAPKNRGTLRASHPEGSPYAQKQACPPDSFPENPTTLPPSHPEPPAPDRQDLSKNPGTLRASHAEPPPGAQTQACPRDSLTGPRDSLPPPPQTPPPAGELS